MHNHEIQKMNMCIDKWSKKQSKITNFAFMGQP